MRTARITAAGRNYIWIYLCSGYALEGEVTKPKVPTLVEAVKMMLAEMDRTAEDGLRLPPFVTDVDRVRAALAAHKEREVVAWGCEAADRLVEAANALAAYCMIDCLEVCVDCRNGVIADHKGAHHLGTNLSYPEKNWRWCKVPRKRVLVDALRVALSKWGNDGS